MKKKLYDFNDKHLGETIYIIGSAPTINKLDDRHLEGFKDKVVIGVNYSHLKVKNLNYMITGHVDSLAYMLEYGPKDIPIFAHYSKQTAYAIEVWSSERVIKMWDLPPSTPLPRHATEKNNICGNTSILLSATHLAYIMGASKIVYVGFEEKSQLHFYNIDKKLESEIITNIEKILASRKYWNPINYSPDWRGISNKVNVHSAFEVLLNKCNNAPPEQPQFNRELDDLKNTPFNPSWNNVINFSAYVSYLNQSNVATHTIEEEGIAIESGCEKITLDSLL